jgi:hypothetical protein
LNVLKPQHVLDHFELSADDSVDVDLTWRTHSCIGIGRLLGFVVGDVFGPLLLRFLHSNREQRRIRQSLHPLYSGTRRDRAEAVLDVEDTALDSEEMDAYLFFEPLSCGLTGNSSSNAPSAICLRRGRA